MSAGYTVMIPWADRPELQISLARNASMFRQHEADVVVINAGGNHRRLTQLVADLPADAATPVRTIDLSDAAFNRALCLNIGALSSTRDYFCFLDADLVLDSPLFAQAADHLASRSRFVAVQKIFESEQGARPEELEGKFLAELVRVTEMITHDGRRAVLKTWTHPGKTHAGDGLVLVRREDMLRVGGLNARLEGYGFEDTDFQLRLQFLLGLERVDTGRVIHLTHEATPERHRETWRKNYRACAENYSRGCFSGSLPQDALEWGDRVTAMC